MTVDLNQFISTILTGLDARVTAAEAGIGKVPVAMYDAAVAGISSPDKSLFKSTLINAGIIIGAPTITVPAQVTGLTLIAIPGALMAAWDVPDDDGGAPISDYKVEYELGGTWFVFNHAESTDPNIKIDGLINGTPTGVRISARNSEGFGLPSAVEIETPVAGWVMPAGLVGDFDSRSISGLAHGAPVETWTDVASFIAATAQPGKAPTYGTAGINGLPYVHFAGTTSSFLELLSGGAIAAAIDSQEYTIVIVLAGTTTTSNNSVVFGAADATTNSRFCMMNSVSQLAPMGSGTGSAVPMTNGAGYRSFGMTVTKTLTPNGGTGNNGRCYYRGLCYSINQDTPTTANPSTGVKYTLAIGVSRGGATNTFPFGGDLYRILVFNRRLDATENLTVEMNNNDTYDQVHPAIALGRMLHIPGNSRGAGVGTSGGTNVTDKFPYKVSQGLSFPIGTYSLTAIGGFTIDDIYEWRTEVTGPAQLLSAASPTIKHRVLYEEYVNSSLSLPIGTIAGPTGMLFETKRVVDYYRANMSNVMIVGATSMDHGNLRDTAGRLPSQWAAALLANVGPTKIDFDFVVDIWNETPLGGSDALLTTAAATTPSWAVMVGGVLTQVSGDGVHGINVAQTILADKWSLVCLATPGF